MGIEGDIVEENVVDEGAPSAATSNPITNPQIDESDEPEVKEEKPAEPAIPKGVQKRIDRAVRAKYEAEARTKMLEERLAALETRQQPPPRVQEDSEPTLDKFQNFDEYVSAKAEWIAARKIEQTLSEREKRQVAERDAADRQKTADSWGKRITQATAEMPDFEDVIASSDVPMTSAMQQTIMESDIGPRIAYYLAQNPDDAVKIAEMSPIRAIAALGRLEERLSQQPASKKVTSAPEPVKSLSGKASSKKNPADMSDAEYAKWRRSGKAA